MINKNNVMKLTTGLLAIAIVGVVALSMDSGEQTEVTPEEFANDFITQLFEKAGATDISISNGKIELEDGIYYYGCALTCYYESDFQLAFVGAGFGKVDGKWAMGIVTIDGEEVYRDAYVVGKLLV